MLRLALYCAPLLLLPVLCAMCTSPPALPAPEVEYDGCAAVFSPGALCVLSSSRALRLWVGVPPNVRLEVRADDTTIASRGEIVRGGQRLSLSVPPGAAGIEVEVADRAPWRIAVAEPGRKPPPGARDLVAEVPAHGKAFNASMRAGDFVACRRMLETARPAPQPPAAWTYQMHFSRAQLAEREGDYRSAFREAQAAVEMAGRVMEDRYLWFAEQETAMILAAVGRSAESARLFEALRQGSTQAVDPCIRGQLFTNQAWAELLAREAGEWLGDPVPLFEQALASYEACAVAKAERKSNTLINLALADLQENRSTRVRQLLRQASELESHPPLLHRLWEFDLEGRLALLKGETTAALRSFAQLDDLARQTGVFDARLRALFGQARVYRELREPARALKALVAAERILDEQSLQIPIYDGRDRFVAARQSIVSLHLELLLDQGRTAEALETARRARARLLRQLAHVDRLATLPPEKRDRRSRLVREFQRKRAHLEARAGEDWRLLPDQLRHEEAVRRAEADAAEKLLDEAFLVLGEPAGRQVPAQQSVRRGELLLVYHPLGAGWWVGFAAGEEGVVAHRFELSLDELAQPATLTALLLQPFHSRIERAQRIRIVPSGRLETVDFHALPFGGDVLVAGRPVIYALDLATAPVAGPGGRRALLVGDPRGDLPGAAAEAVAVRKALQSDRPPWTTEELAAGEASAEAVGRRLAAIDLFHYAGHSSFSGLGGWDSSLLLAKDTKLTVGDLLAVDSLPRWVVLSGCETGRSTAEIPVAGLSLAHAFLLAGSRGVVASTRPANDRSLPAFFADFYRQWQGDADLAFALQRAELEWRRQDPQADWASFRLFEP